MNGKVTAQTGGSANADFISWFQELVPQAPRPWVIVAAAVLDEQLKRLLTGFCREDATASGTAEKVLFGSNGPFGSYGSRITASWSLGLISKETRDALRTLKSERNDAAHQTSFKLGAKKLEDCFNYARGSDFESILNAVELKSERSGIANGKPAQVTIDFRAIAPVSVDLTTIVLVVAYAIRMKADAALKESARNHLRIALTDQILSRI